MGCSHLAGLAVHVERDHDAVGDLASAAIHQILGQVGGQVALTRPARPGQDEAAVLEQEADVVLHHGLGDESLEHQAVDAFLLQSWRGGDATINIEVWLQTREVKLQLNRV